MDDIEFPDPPIGHVWRVSPSNISSEYRLELVHVPTNSVSEYSLVYVYTLSAGTLEEAAWIILKNVEAKRRAPMYLGDYPKGRLAEVEREVNGGDSE